MLSLNIGIILFYIFERLIELVVSARNKIMLLKEGDLKILNKNESIQMKLFHLSWFALLLIESSPEKVLSGNLFYIVVTILIAAQGLRWLAIFTLGRYWSVDVYDMKSHAVINSGLYSYIKHPNYLAVIIELLFIPLLLGCPVVMVIGSLGNLLILKRRIAMEEGALTLQGEYVEKFARKRRFL